MTAVAEASAPAPVRPAYRGKVTQGRVLNSEWIKFRTLRSTLWSLVVAIGLMLFICFMFSMVMSNKWDTMSAARRAEFDPITVPLRGYNIGQLAVGVLGVMVITGEYSTGMIRATMSAVPKRLPVLWAKLAVFAAVVWVLMTVTAFACFFVGQAFFSAKHIGTTLSAPGAARIVFGTGLYLTFVGLLGVALGTIIRSTAGAITALVGVLMVLPILGEVLNQTSYGPDVTPYLPSNAGTALLNLHPDPNGGMMPWTGFGLFAGYVVGAIVIAAFLLKRRDA